MRSSGSRKKKGEAIKQQGHTRDHDSNSMLIGGGGGVDHHPEDASKGYHSEDSSINDTPLAILVKDNTMYDPDMSTYTCQVCGYVTDDLCPIEVIEDHVMRCVTKKELEEKFSEINSDLNISVSTISQSNLSQMSYYMTKALIMFERRTAFNKVALALVKK